MSHFLFAFLMGVGIGAICGRVVNRFGKWLGVFQDVVGVSVAVGVTALVLWVCQ